MTTTPTPTRLAHPTQRCRRCACVYDEYAELAEPGPVPGWQFGLCWCPRCWQDRSTMGDVVQTCEDANSNSGQADSANIVTNS